MSQALQLAGKGMHSTAPNPRVGCVIINDNKVVGEGYHVKAGEPHAEIIALEQAGEYAQGATVYVTLEPCCHTGKTPPCTDALIEAGVKKVVAAQRDPHHRVAGQGFAALEAAGIEVKEGLLQAQAAQLNPGFIKRMQHGMPFVRIKLASSLDGRTAMASGESKWITGESARHDVQHWRARSSAILTGVGTILADDPALNTRLDDTSTHQAVRVILDTQLRTPVDAKLFQHKGNVIIMTAVADVEQRALFNKHDVEFITCPSSENGVDLQFVLTQLASLEINEVHVECGATLAGSFLQHDLVDEIVLYLAPKLMGDVARGLFHLPELETMADSIKLQIQDVRQFGDDIRLIVAPTKKVV